MSFYSSNVLTDHGWTIYIRFKVWLIASFEDGGYQVFELPGDALVAGSGIKFLTLLPVTNSSGVRLSLVDSAQGKLFEAALTLHTTGFQPPVAELNCEEFRSAIKLKRQQFAYEIITSGCLR